MGKNLNFKMLIYKDVLGGDELFSDSYPIKLVDDIIYEVEGKTIKESGDIDEALIGGNKAADATEEDESVASTTITGINIVLTHKYVETSMSKGQFKDWLKDYMKKVKKRVSDKNEKNGEEVQAEKVKCFEKGMQKWAMGVIKSLMSGGFGSQKTCQMMV